MSAAPAKPEVAAALRTIDAAIAVYSLRDLSPLMAALSARSCAVSARLILATEADMVPRWLPAREAAKRLDCSVRTLGRRRRLDGYREFIVPGEVRGFKVDSVRLEAFLRGQS